MSDGLTRLLFEDLALLLLAEAAALAVVIGIHRSRMTPRTRRLVWITLALCVVLVVMQHVVVTDREAIRATIEDMARDVVDGDVASLGEKLDERMTLGPIKGKGAVLHHAHLTLQEYDVRNARVSAFEIDLENRLAQVRFQAVGDIHGRQTEGFRTPMLWKLTMVRSPRGWRVLHGTYEFGLAGFGR